MRGKIEAVCGPMFGGKSTYLLNKIQRSTLAKKKVLLVKPRIDDRYSKNEVVSHEGKRMVCHIIDKAEDILTLMEGKNYAVVGIDEAQFLKGLVPIVKQISAQGTKVILAFLDMDAEGNPFGDAGGILAIAHAVTKVTAVCVVCGEDAQHTQRTQQHQEQVHVGGTSDYEARCRACWKP